MCIEMLAGHECTLSSGGWSNQGGDCCTVSCMLLIFNSNAIPLLDYFIQCSMTLRMPNAFAMLNNMQW